MFRLVIKLAFKIRIALNNNKTSENITHIIHNLHYKFFTGLSNSIYNPVMNKKISINNL